MLVNTASIIYFSATGTTKRILDEILEGMEIEKRNIIDLSKKIYPGESKIVINEDIIIIGAPIHYNKIPKLILPALNSLKAKGQPVFLVTVYGNVNKGIGLRELYEISENIGCQVIGGANFIAEHSLSHETYEIAHGRPDIDDLKVARSLGKKIIETLASCDSIENVPKHSFSEKLGFFSRMFSNIGIKFISKQPKIDKLLCKNCKICVEICPTNAIDFDSLEINENNCIRCFACAKNCPNDARKIELKMKSMIKFYFKKAHVMRREPEIFF